MRSFSSLLCHILGSYPEISGYAQTHLSYFGSLDLQRLARKVQQVTGNPVLGRYVLDNSDVVAVSLAIDHAGAAT